MVSPGTMKYGPAPVGDTYGPATGNATKSAQKRWQATGFAAMNQPVAPVAPVDLSHEADFSIGGAAVRPSLRTFAVNGAEEIIEPRVMQVLVALARRAGEVVSRDDLVTMCWGGRVVGDDAISRTIAMIRKLAETSGAFSIETVPRVGYRLM